MPSGSGIGRSPKGELDPRTVRTLRSLRKQAGPTPNGARDPKTMRDAERFVQGLNRRFTADPAVPLVEQVKGAASLRRAVDALRRAT